MENKKQHDSDKKMEDNKIAPLKFPKTVSLTHLASRETTAEIRWKPSIEHSGLNWKVVQESKQIAVILILSLQLSCWEYFGAGAWSCYASISYLVGTLESTSEEQRNMQCIAVTANIREIQESKALKQGQAVTWSGTRRRWLSSQFMG